MPHASYPAAASLFKSTTNRLKRWYICAHGPTVSFLCNCVTIPPRPLLNPSESAHPAGERVMMGLAKLCTHCISLWSGLEDWRSCTKTWALLLSSLCKHMRIRSKPQRITVKARHHNQILENDEEVNGQTDLAVFMLDLWNWGPVRQQHFHYLGMTIPHLTNDEKCLKNNRVISHFA